MNWKSGDKAYCVNDEGVSILKEGTIYLVDEVLSPDTGPILSLAGIRSNIYGRDIIRLFKASRFKKIIPRSERSKS